ncbi:MAG: tetratricopeptide repeat protein [Acidobacteriota bacterium]|nr:tetratricopeptide repeat protein [Acidobacteriota bacterium]MDE2922529.1 tetratricopeptide repeat protein [Acidobacteriota bacterium]MDE3265486.1 tetratricopeptide repeat protein [Acidobacteriota bacterium]
MRRPALRRVTMLVLSGALAAVPVLSQDEELPVVTEAQPVDGPPAAPEPAELWVNGNAAYEAGDFGRAAALYREMREMGVDNGHLHYNLGNAYLRAGELGRSIASYRRALELLPRDEDASANLTFARRSARDEIVPPEPPVLLRSVLFWHYSLAPVEVLRSAVLVGLGFWIVLAFRLYRPASEVLRWSAVCLLAVGLALAGSLVAHAAFSSPVAVVLPQEIDLHAAAGEGSVVRFRLHAGTEARVIEQRPEWVRIELPDGLRGWSLREYLEIVE